MLLAVQTSLLGLEALHIWQTSETDRQTDIVFLHLFPLIGTGFLAFLPFLISFLSYVLLFLYKITSDQKLCTYLQLDQRVGVYFTISIEYNTM